MTSLRKRLGTIATTSLIALSASSALATPAWASPFVDVPSSHWVETSGVLDEALTEGIINGSTNENGDRIFRPDDSITRVEVASMLMNLAGAEDGAYGKVDTTSWADASSNVWYTSVLNWAEETGVLNGSNGYVRPNDKITREEIATMLGNFERTFGDSDAKGDVISLNSYEDGSQVSSWAQETVAWAVESEIMGATANLYPTSNATRAEATKMVVALGNLGEQTDAAPTPEPEPEPGQAGRRARRRSRQHARQLGQPGREGREHRPAVRGHAVPVRRREPRGRLRLLWPGYVRVRTAGLRPAA